MSIKSKKIKYVKYHSGRNLEFQPKLIEIQTEKFKLKFHFRHLIETKYFDRNSTKLITIIQILRSTRLAWSGLAHDRVVRSSPIGSRCRLCRD